MRSSPKVSIALSGSSVYDDLPWIKSLQTFVKNIADTKKHLKIFGVCWGQQLIGQIFGVSAIKAYPAVSEAVSNFSSHPKGRHCAGL